MPDPDLSVHRYTPVISVKDPRALAVREVRFYRREAQDIADVHVRQQVFDVIGRPVLSRDPRLFALAEVDSEVPANLTHTFSLGGSLLLSESTDAGWRLGLNGEAGQRLESWDGRGTHSIVDYDELLRPQAIQQQALAEPAFTLERFTYGNADEDAALHNGCGRLLRHDDPAGTHWAEEYGVGGALLQETRRFLLGLESPDWPIQERERDALLEPLAQAALTRHHVNAMGETTGQTDAQGNVRRLEMTCAGTLRGTHVQLAGQAEQRLVGDICYNAFGQVETETAGNGVQTRTVYDPANGLLQRLTACRSDDTTLQDLNYEHDPVGNILRIEDAAQSTRYFRNQAVADVCTYRYDTLYQLIQATGREALDTAIHPPLPVFQSPADPNQLATYSQFYDYDAGGNLLTLRHVGGQQYTRRMITARYSNRSLPILDDHIPDEEELTAAFDANGNLLQLQPGQGLMWDARNQLQQVTPVEREEAENDDERYVYDGNGQRVRKVRTALAANTTHLAEVRYLPGLEIRTDTATGESLHVITAPAGRCEVRVLHWLEDSNRDDIANDQVRYSLRDHLRSSTLELDCAADVISQERYYPFGGTCWWAGRSRVEADSKTVRYSGKERDASGLYYYGLRYYAPWLCRWINPDPAGDVDGINLFKFAKNNPVSKRDQDGAQTYSLNEIFSMDDQQERKKLIGMEALRRQEAIFMNSGLLVSQWQSTYMNAYSYDSGPFVNDYLRLGKEKVYSAGFFSLEANIGAQSEMRVSDLIDIVETLPGAGDVSLYRGGSGSRGTSGGFFREGWLSPGNILVNTDFASFTENPLVAKDFASVKADGHAKFDMTSVIFELNQHTSIKVFAPFSLRSKDPFWESESLANPGAAFEIVSIDTPEVTIQGQRQSYVKVSMNEVHPPKISLQRGGLGSGLTLPSDVYDLRTGEPIDIDLFESRLGRSSRKVLRSYYH